ncbi:MAG TPA: FHA domain-containing protein [Kofleriaceae bacterium]|jgi:hypothetical protein|nr:FHA domain-containing protein [Kofleriaceae bacterium]
MKATTRYAIAIAAALGAIISVPRAARAQLEVHLSSKPNEDPKAKEAGTNAPIIEATVIGGAAPEAAKLALTQTDAKPAAVTIKATSVKKYVEGPENIAIVVLIEGHELWMGNEAYADEADKAVGVFSKLGPALDAVSKAGPPGSKGEIIIYGKAGALVKQAWIDLPQLTADKLGAQKDYQGTTTRELVAGVNQAYADLQKVSASRKALIVIGDGTDTNADAAKAQLADFKKKFEAAHVELFGIFYQIEGFEGDQSVVKSLVGTGIKTANSMDNIANQASAIVGELQNRYYAVFQGFDTKLNAGFTWDTKEHAFSLKIDQDEADAGTLTMVPEWHLPVPSHFPWLWVILGSIVGLILLLLIIAKVAKKPVAAPPPMVVQQPIAAPAAPPPPAAPSAPMKTMMVNLNAGDDGWPVVAWLVPLNGPNQFQTFKLGSNTVIGTGGGAHVVVNDGFMSTEHAMIVASPSGFVLKDKGSTNGVLVNERRVNDHELVDNDVILMGKTNFKFKTTI